MDRLYLAAAAALLIGTAGCGRAPADAPEGVVVERPEAPLEAQPVELSVAEIDQLAADELLLLELLDEGLPVEDVELADCREAIERIEAFVADFWDIADQLGDLRLQHLGQLIDLNSYAQEQRLWLVQLPVAVVLAPKWEEIDDAAAFTEAEQLTARLPTVLAEDDALAESRRRLVTGVKTMRDAATAVLERLDAATQLSERCAALVDTWPGSGGPGAALRAPLSTLLDSFGSTLAAIDSIDAKRRDLLIGLHGDWEGLLHYVRARLYPDNGAITGIAPSEEAILLEMRRQIWAVSGMMGYLQFEGGAPHLSLRSRRVLGVLLDDLEHNLPSVVLSARNRASAESRLDYAHRLLEASIEYHGRLDASGHETLASWRYRRVAAELDYDPTQPTSELCRTLWTRCGVPTLEGELSCEQLADDCGAGGAQ